MTRKQGSDLPLPDDIDGPLGNPSSHTNLPGRLTGSRQSWANDCTRSEPGGWRHCRGEPLRCWDDAGRADSHRPGINLWTRRRRTRSLRGSRAHTWTTWGLRQPGAPEHAWSWAGGQFNTAMGARDFQVSLRGRTNLGTGRDTPRLPFCPGISWGGRQPTAWIRAGDQTEEDEHDNSWPLRPGNHFQQHLDWTQNWTRINGHEPWRSCTQSSPFARKAVQRGSRLIQVTWPAT